MQLLIMMMILLLLLQTVAADNNDNFAATVAVTAVVDGERMAMKRFLSMKIAMMIIPSMMMIDAAVVENRC